MLETRAARPGVREEGITTRQDRLTQRNAQRFEGVVSLAYVPEHVDKEGCLRAAARDNDAQDFTAQEERDKALGFRCQ